MSSKAEQYAKADSAPSKGEAQMEVLNARLTQDLRTQIRRLGAFPVYSSTWMEMVESLNHIGSVSTMESSLPQAKEGATLWETEEQAIRFILEDGKLNLCVRAMIDFRSNWHSGDHRTQQNGFKQAVADFEKGLGSLLKNAWLHIEAIQITDMNAFCRHIGDVLVYGLQNNAARLHELLDTGSFADTQEGYLYHYLHLFLRDVEATGEARLMPYLRLNGIFMGCVRSLALPKMQQHMPSALKEKALGVLSLMVLTEDFSTYRDEYVGVGGVGGDTDADADTEARANLELLLVLKRDVLGPVLKDKELSMDRKRALRPLGDAIDKAKRLGGSSSSSSSSSKK
jgi:hypothetical protein